MRIDFTGTDRRTKRLMEAEASQCGWVAGNCSGIFRSCSRRNACCLLGRTAAARPRCAPAGRRDGAGCGTIRRADGVQILYFDQNRERLDPSQTLRRALAPEGDTVISGVARCTWRDGRRGSLPWEQLELPVSRLSGGEQARVLIAR